jgi:hypothetical protein
MDESAVREQARAFSDALVAGDIDRAIGHFSNELRRNLGEVIALLPLPANDAGVESVAHGGAGYDVVIRIQGETEEVQIQTRWKDRDGQPTIVEASHLSKTVTEAPIGEGEGEDEIEGEAAGNA